MFKKVFSQLARPRSFLATLWVKLGHPSGEEYAGFLKQHKLFYQQGENCSILPSTLFTDPQNVRMGNNVQFATCTILGHDGSIAMLNRAFGVTLDSMGVVDIKDDVFIGHQALVMPNVTIGPRAIVAAGSVVTRDVPPDDIVAGVPARRIGSVSELVARRAAQTASRPWADLLAKRGPFPYDAAVEAELTRRRLAFFFEESRERSQCRVSNLVDG